MANQEFNKGQPFQGMRERQVFTAPEVMVRFMCNVHGWMAAYVGVVAHPFFAVTDDDGTFELKGCRRAPTRSRRGTRSSAAQTRAGDHRRQASADGDVHVQSGQ